MANTASDSLLYRGLFSVVPLCLFISHNTDTSTNSEQKVAVRSHAVSEFLSRNVMHCPLIPLLFFELSEPQTELYKVQASLLALAGLITESLASLGECDIVWVLRADWVCSVPVLIDDWAGRAEIRRTGLAGSTDGWPLGAPRVTETLQSCRARVMERRGRRKHDLSRLLPSLGVHLYSIPHCNYTIMEAGRQNKWSPTELCLVSDALKGQNSKWWFLLGTSELLCAGGSQVVK